MLSFADWTAQQSAPKTGGQSFADWQSSQEPATPLSLPDWEYGGYDGELQNRWSGGNKDAIRKSDLVSDYYGAMVSDYLPQLDTFAQENAGKMVEFDPTRFMSIDDFGLGTYRGDLRGDIEQKWYLDDKAVDDLNSWQNYWVKEQNEYYDPNSGEYRTREYKPLNGYDFEGNRSFGPLAGELYSLSNVPVNGESGWAPPPDGLSGEFTRVGVSRQETAQEAAARMVANGGGYKTGWKDNASENRFDFMDERHLNDLMVDHSGKWGKDFVNDPTLKQYLDNPEWVARDEDGNITNVRAELYPLLMRESLGEEYRDISRGGTKESGGFGDFIGAAILGVATGGLGLAGASALGLGTAAAGAGLGATAAGMGAGGLATAGAIGGGLSSALTGGDVLKGALTGGLTGGFSKFASPYVGNTLGNMGVTGTMNKALTGGLTSTLGGGLSSAITGGQFNPISSFASGATQGYMGSQAGKDMLGGIGITDPYLQRMAGSLASGTAGSLAAGKNPNMQGMLANTGMKTFQQWLNDQSRG